MFCKNCGNQINQGGSFCPNCGTPIESNVNVNNTQTNVSQVPVNNYNQVQQNNINNTPKKDNSKTIILIVCLSLVGLLLIIGGIVLINQIKLARVDKLLQEEAQNINDYLDNDFDNYYEEEQEEKKYSVGDSIQLLDGSSWYVLSQTDSKITLLSSTNYGDVVYYSAGQNYYDESNVKNIIENQYLPELKTSISAKNGDISNLSARILSVEEIREILNISSDVNATDIEISSSYKWLFETGSYWTNSHAENSLYESAYIVESWGSFAYINEDIAGLGLTSGNQFYIRPVIETTIDNIK